MQLLSEFLRELHPELHRITKFGAIGILATLIHVIVFSLLMEFTQSQAMLANAVAFGLAFVVSFCGHVNWTFRDAPKSINSFYRFVVISLLGLLANSAFAFGIVDILKLSYLYAALLMALVTPMATYFGLRHWAFGRS